MIGALGGPSLLAQLAENSGRVQQQLAAALQQQSTGRVSESYAGLGSGVRTSVDLRPALQHTQVWQANIDVATSRLDVTQTALKQISAIAADFYAQTNTINDINGAGVASLAANAKTALQQVAQLLNTRDGNTYVFAGQNPDTPPLPNTDAATVGAAVLASDTATAPFASLGTAVPQVEVGDGQTVAVGLLANQNTLATSEAPSTGSYMRDLLRGLATLSNLTSATATLAVGADTRMRLGSVVKAAATEAGALGTIQTDLVARKETLAATRISLTQQVSNVEDVDLAATLTRISSLQTQLQASYQVIAGVKSLSLANFI